MTAAQLRQAVQAVVQAHHKYHTFYSIWSDAKDRETELTYPCAVWDSWRTWIEEDAAGALNRSVAVRLLIVTAVTTDRTPGDRDAAVEAADQAAEDYILKLRELYPDMAITNVATTTQFDEYTQLETGVILSFTATGGPLCLDDSAFAPVCAAGVVVNSDGSFTLSVPSGGTATLPDVTHTDSDGTPVVLPGMVPMVCTPGSTPVATTVNGVASDVPDIHVKQGGVDVGTLDPVTGIHTVPTCPPAGDGTAVLKDAAGTLISTTPVPAEGSVDITAPSAEAQLVDSGGATIGSPYPILSNDTRTITVADSVITLPNGSTKNVKATQPYTAPDVSPLKTVWQAGHAASAVWTVTADEVGTYAAPTQDGSSGTIEYSRNAGAWTSGSFTLAIGNTIQFRRSSYAAQGWARWAR